MGLRNLTADDGFDYVCAICKDFGELLCCEQCGQGFHLLCLNLDSLPKEDSWLCEDCSENKVRCFECGKLGAFTEHMVKCSHGTCRKFYHKECTQAWMRGHDDEMALQCPHHYCNVCGLKRSHDGQWKLYRCLECPTSYHENCLPYGSKKLYDIPGYIVCWKHTVFCKGGEEELSIDKASTNECNRVHDPPGVFEALPVPEQCYEFEVPRTIHGIVKKQKQRPQPYVNIRRNIYVVKKPRKRLEDEYMHCSCARLGGTRATCSAKECICGMLQYSCSPSCGCGDACTNLAFQKREGRKLQLVKTEKCGWGLIAGEKIKAGDFLIEYVGEVIDDKTCEERFWAMKTSGEKNFYMCEISREMVIDSSFKGNISRFINHSCSPNTELQKWQIDGEIRIGIFAISDIQLDEPITYDYQFVPFGTDQECHCGAKLCRGMLGAKPNKHKISNSAALQIVTREIMTRTSKSRDVLNSNGFRRIDEFFRQQKSRFPSVTKLEGPKMLVPKPKASCLGSRVRIWWPLDKKFYSGRITAFNSRDGTHTVEYDDGDVEILSMAKETWELES